MKRNQDRPKYMPTPDEIEAETTRIRAGWNDNEYRKRLAYSYWPARVPRGRFVEENIEVSHDD